MKYLFLFLSLCLLSGCAFTDINVMPGSSSINSNITGGDQREIVVVSPFSDDRKIKNRCGMKKNGYNMDTADAICTVSPASKLADLLVDELGKAGFKVKTQGEAQSQSGVKINGSLIQFFVEPVIGFAMGALETDIHIRLVATSQNGLHAERSFFIKGTESAMVGSESNAQKSIDSATAIVIKQMVTAIISLFNKYPVLGELHSIFIQQKAV
ncbi:MAG: hypothetical protein RIR39_2412 [Pseudomonadota bacterium]|jgi:uncharacterized lipoprotein YajG